MYQGRPEVLRAAPDDVRPQRSASLYDGHLEATEQSISAICGTLLLLSGLRRPACRC